MGLPDWTPGGLLPAGIHAATMADIHERFVEDAPERTHRELLFNVFQTYMNLLQRFVHSGRVWVDGGFGTQKSTAPHDVDVVVHPGDWRALEALPESSQTDLLGLLTHQDIIIGSFDPPQYWPRLQPIGGILDSFLCYPGQEDAWQQIWSCVKGADGLIVEGAVKGFVELSW